MASFRNDATRLAQDWGINLPGVTHYVGEKGNAYDAAPVFGATTAPNSGIPAVINTMVDPQLIRQLIAPTKSETIYGSQNKGDRAIKTVISRSLRLPAMPWLMVTTSRLVTARPTPTG